MTVRSMLTGLRQGVETPLQRLAPAARVVLGLGGAAAVVAGCLSAWATFVFVDPQGNPTPFPGSMTMGGSPGGARLFPLVLVAAVALIFVDVGGRRRAGVDASVGIVVLAGSTLIWMAVAGGGLGAVTPGPFAAVLGGILMAVAFLALPADRPLRPRPVRPLAAIVSIALTTAAVVSVVWWGLRIDESSRFIAFGLWVLFVSLALAALGVFTWLARANRRYRLLGVALAFAAAAAFPFTQGGDAYWLRVFASLGVFAAAAIGLNVVVGLAGLLDLGYIAFFGVGAYTGALLSNAVSTTAIGHVHVPFPLAFVIGAAVAAGFGLLIGAPTLRLRGDYLAIVTLGFGEIFRISANNLGPVTSGPNGISGIPDLALRWRLSLFGATLFAVKFSFGQPHTVFGIVLPAFANYYFLELLLIAGAAYAFVQLNNSRIGRGWVAIREDELAAAAMGVNTTALKLLAFAIGAFMAGAAGTVSAHVGTQVSPDSFTFLESITLVAAVVLGGMGNVTGAILGASLLYIIPEKLRVFQDKRLLIFGLALILMMRFRPEGLIPSRRRQAEFHEQPTDEGAQAIEQGSFLPEPKGLP